MEAALVSVSQGVMNSLLGKLGDLLTEKYELMTGVRDDVMFLKAELETIRAFLQDLDCVEEPSALVKAWRKEVRELSYDIEDCVDEFMLRLHADPKSKPHGFRGIMERTMNLFTKAPTRDRIGTEIQGLKRRVVEVNERRVRYRLDDAVSKLDNAVAIDPRLPAMYQYAADLVGIDGPKADLVKLLMAEEGEAQEKLKVASIVGCGGLGKTTLANEVYRELKGQFQCTAFVSVSQKPDLTKVLREILSQVSQQDQASIPREWDENELIKKLRAFLQNKRYFIIIDDIWSTSAWKFIRCALVKNNSGSRIMTTTRISDVAKFCCFPHENYVCKLKTLDSAESKKLFFKRIFCDENRCPAQLKQVSDRILKKCGGLPLAIITIASMLANKPKTMAQWKVVHDSIGSGLVRSSCVKEMEKILSLSYNDLPCCLKTCLLYISMYPEDYMIKRHFLILRWVAEGFINTEGGQDLEEAGECYFNELINRSMIQPVDIDYEGRARACRIHDMIRDLIQSKAGEENFVTLFGEQKDSVLLPDKIRRLYLDCRDEEYAMVPSTKVFPHVRSQVLFGKAEWMPSLSNFRVLRVLDLGGSENLKNHHIESIEKLFQLKYLVLGSGNITKLPEQIGELQHLETLDLKRTSVRELPASVVRLRRLVHLLVFEAKLPDGIGSMQALQELSGIDIYNSSADSVLDLGNLNKLRTLVWYSYSTQNDEETCMYNFYSSISRLSNLRSLASEGFFVHSKEVDLRFPHLLQKLSITGCLYGIPESMASLRELTFLHICIKQVKAEDLQLLADLPALLHLEIRSLSFAVPQERLDVGSRGFPCLKNFSSIFCENVRLDVGSRGFPCLNKFSLSSSIGNVVWLMFEPGAMPMLKELYLYSRAAVTSAQYGSFNFDIQHLSPSLKQVDFTIYCDGAKRWEVEAAEAAITNAANIHPNHPTLHMKRRLEDMMKEEVETSEEEGDTEQEEEAVEETQSNS